MTAATHHPLVPLCQVVRRPTRPTMQTRHGFAVRLGRTDAVGLEDGDQAENASQSREAAVNFRIVDDDDDDLDASVATVLAIDDDPEMLDFLTMLLGEQFEITTRTDALSGLLAAGDLIPDIVILDLVMPGFGGWDVVRTLREDPRTHDIYIVILTALDDPETEERALRENCGFVRKPLQTEANVATLVRTLTQR